MLNNNSVTDHEYEISHDQNLISRTDTKGRITYASPTFCEVSGYSAVELVGAPHSLIRHPDMPKAAFANLWQTIEAGEVWSGIVKNRRKNGDFYWVHAHVVPILENGEVQGYTSVRVKPAMADRQRAEVAYARMRGGDSRGIRLERGRIVSSGAGQYLMRLVPRGHARFLVLIVLVTLIALMLSSWLGGWGRAAAGAVILILAIIGSRRFNAAMADLGGFAMQMAAGNLAAAPPSARLDGLDQIIRAMQIMQRSLTNIGTEIHCTLEIVERETLGMERDNHSLATSTREQSTALGLTASGIDGLTATVQHNATSAERAKIEARRVRETVNRSRRDVAWLVESIEHIATSAGKMTEAINAIETLASKTNLLAINASVEAAHAGEHGRGFAVVAQEVRLLAASSAESADHVRALIGSTLRGIETGRSRIGQLSQNNQGVVEAVSSIDTLIGSMADAFQQQAASLEQVNQEMGEMNEVTRRSADSVANSAVLGELLAGRVEQLAMVISSLRQASSGKERVSREQRFRAHAVRKAAMSDGAGLPPEPLARNSVASL